MVSSTDKRQEHRRFDNKDRATTSSLTNHILPTHPRRVQLAVTK